MPETIISLSQINNQLSNSEEIVLSTENLGTDLFEQVKTLFKQEDFQLVECHDIISEGNYLAFGATLTSLRSWQSLDVECCFIDYPAAGNRQFLFLVTFLGDVSTYNYLAQYTGNTERYRESIVNLYTEVTGTDALRLFFSSIDYNSTTFKNAPFPGIFINVLSSNRVKHGLNLVPEFTITPEVAGYLSEKFGGIPETIYTCHGIINPGETGLYLLLECNMSTKKTIGPFTLFFERLAMGFPLEHEDILAPDFFFTGVTRINEFSFKISTKFNLYKGQLLLSFTDLPAFGKFLTLIGFDSLIAGFQQTVPQLLDIKLSDLFLGIDINHQTIELIGISLSSETNIPLIENMVSLKPKLGLTISAPFDPDYCNVEGKLSGTWMLGSTAFDTYVDYPALNIFAGMAEGETLDMKALTDRVFPGIKLPSISFTGMELRGNLNDKSFSAEISGGSDWAFTVANQTFSVKNISLGMDYNGEQISEARMIGTLTLEQLDLVVSTIYNKDKGWMLSCGSAFGETINLSLLANKFMKAYKLPGGLPDLNLRNINFSAAPAIGEYSISGQAANDWVLMDGLTINIEEFAVTQTLIDKKFSLSGLFSARMTLGGTEIYLTAEKSSAGAPFEFKANVPLLKLTDLAQSLLKGVTIPTGFPNLVLKDINLSFIPDTKEFSLACKSDDEWKINIGKTDLVINAMSLQIKRKTDGTKTTTTGLVSGSMALGNATFSIVYDFTAAASEIRTSATKLNLATIVEKMLGDIVFPKEIPNVVFDSVEFSIIPSTKEFSLTAISTTDWTMPLGTAGVLIEDIRFSASRKKVKDKDSFVTTGTFSGKALIGTAATSLEYNFPGDFVFKTRIPELSLSPIIQDLCGTQSMMGLPVPANISKMKLTEIDVMAAPEQKKFSISANSSFGRAELIITKNEQGKWVFIAAFAPPATWHFSAIDNSLKALDNLRLDKTGMVFCSAPDPGVSLTIIQTPAELTIGSGLTFFTSLDPSVLGVKDLMNIKTLTVSTVIDTNPANIKLAVGIAGSFKIGKSVTMSDMKFFLKPVPSNFELGISGSLLAKLHLSELLFAGSLSVKPAERSASFNATMQGFWKEPFGIKGLAMGNIALQVGIGIVPPPAVAAPIVGIAGSIVIGTVTGSAAVKFDTANPSKSMIAASFNKLSLKEVVQTFCDATIYSQIPVEIRNTVLAAGLSDVAVYVVPQTTTIGELVYEAGFRFEGKLSIGQFDAKFFFLLSYSEGFAVKASMDPIRLGDVFTLAGTGQLPGPALDIDLRKGGKPAIVIGGLAKILGLQAATLVSISDKGFLFFVEGKIFDIFVAGLTVSGGNLKNGGDFYIKAEMRNDLISFVRDKARQAIQDTASGATKDIEKKQKEVAGYQKEVNSIQGDIDKMRKTIQAERDKDIKKLNAAQKDLTAGQNQVNSLQSYINGAKKDIDGNNAEIKAKKKWYDNLEWYEQPVQWPVYLSYAAAKQAEIAFWYSEIGVWEAAKATANAALEIAKDALELIEKGLKTFPIDADPRIVLLSAEKSTATLALSAVNSILETAKKAVGGLASVGDFVVKYGIGGLFDVKGASFEGQLNVLKGGAVTMAINVTLMNKPKNMSLAFNFKDTTSSVKSLIDHLVAEIKKM